MSENAHFGLVNPVFASIGAVVTFYATFRLASSVFRGIKTFCLAGALGLSVDVKSYGDWAAVTGATDGIGEAYAEQLAAKGMNIVLLSRSQDKLDTIAAKLASKYGVKTKTIAVDFTGSEEIYSEIANEVAGMNIGVLVNNVGMSYSHPQYFHELPNPQKLIKDMVNLNCMAATMMTLVMLPGMVERQRGIVINVSSASGMFPSPLLAVYSASKAYIDFFTRALQVEYGPKGIIFQCVLPFFVSTKLSKIRRASLTVPTPTTYVRSALSTLGIELRTNGCLTHSIQGWVTDMTPDWVLNKVQMGMHLGIRKSALKKQQSKKSE